MRRVIRVIVVLLFWAVPAQGQIVIDGAESVRQDNIAKIEAERPILAYVLSGGFLLGALALGFMNSKRTDLD